MKQLAVVEKETGGKLVHWVAIVSDKAPKSDVEAEVQATGISMPVLIDVGDALYGRLGVALTPVTGITDKDHRLVAYQPYTKLNYAEVVRAQIRHLLKEIDDEELANVIRPPAAAQGSDAAAAPRRLTLAEKLFQAKNYERALENARISADDDPNSAAAHVLIGKILAAEGKCAEAQAAFEQAIQLDPANAEGVVGKRGCEGKESGL